jgi:crossover junction endodeoxyribonuclease RusA
MEAYTLACVAGVHRAAPEFPNVKVTFHPPDNRRRDTDNMLASCKASLDGLALAMGVDDADWNLTIARADPVKGGAVVVEIGR